MSRRKISKADRISSLSDGVLCHILSFLPTKRAVATSILSKRWTHLWRFVLALDFDYSDTTRKDGQAYFRFNEFVYSVLLSRDAAHCIKSFRLDNISDSDLPNVTKWVNFVIQHRVEYLHLHNADLYLKPKLSASSILSCTTLVVLKFYGFDVEGFSSVRLPSLKILHLEYIGFPKVRDFTLLLAGCPILENLQASYIEFDFDSEDSLTYQEFKNLSLSKLTRADIIGCYCHSLLKALYNVESLRIEIDKIYRHDDDIPTFHNLTRLELFSLYFYWHLLVEVLKNCPMLQHFDLYQNEAGDRLWLNEAHKENWVDPGFVPQCLSLHLRTCTLGNFLGLQGELLMTRYILKNARVLETMTIRCARVVDTMTISSRQQSKIKRKLSSCPRASATCQLSFR